MRNDLDIAYKYPFSDEAKKILEEEKISKLDYKYMEFGGNHLLEALQSQMSYREISLDKVKIDYLITYVYSRLILSSMKNPFYIDTYALSEASRSVDALSKSSEEEILHISDELGVRLKLKNGTKSDQRYFEIKFYDFLSFATQEERFKLVSQRLSKGIVLLERNAVPEFLKEAIKRKIMRGMPIDYNEIPNEVKTYSKTLRLITKGSEVILPRDRKGSVGWIDKLLDTPIPDVRHRTVNLILAPYLVNIKGLSLDDAAKIIDEYIERCKRIEPNTKINERYVRYQCEYAKKKGLKPLSFERAKELIGDYIELIGS